MEQSYKACPESYKTPCKLTMNNGHTDINSGKQSGLFVFTVTVSTGLGDLDFSR